MPIWGDAWATYYDNKTNTIWLLSPRQCANANCNYASKVITYNINDNIFENKTPISNHTLAMNGITSRYAVAIGDEIYFNGDGGYVDKYNVKTGKTTNAFYQGDKHGCLVADDRFLFIIGGMALGGVQGHNWLVIYDTFNNQWHQGSSLLWYPRYLSCELINGTIYTFGGDDATPRSYIHKVEIGTGEDVLNNLNKEWSNIGNLNVERALHNSVRCNNVENNLIYIIGGMNATLDTGDLHFLAESSIDIFDISTETVETATFTLNQMRLNPAVICVDKHIYIFGGRASSDGSTLNSWEKSNELYSSSPSTLPTITPTAKTASPSYNPTMRVIASSSSTETFSITEALISTATVSVSDIETSATTTTTFFRHTYQKVKTKTNTNVGIIVVMISAIIMLTCICITAWIYIVHYFGPKLKQMIRRTAVRMTSNGMNELNLSKTVHIRNVVVVTDVNDKEHHSQPRAMGNVQLELASVITTPEQEDISERRTVEGMGEAVSYSNSVEGGALPQTPKEKQTVEGDEMDIVYVENNTTKGYAYTDDGAQI